MLHQMTSVHKHIQNIISIFFGAISKLLASLCLKSCPDKRSSTVYCTYTLMSVVLKKGKLPCNIDKVCVVEHEKF